ncbi:phytanoyl-CoA dioxygenase family protein [Negadavirga shengliensis]|uniref:Phytanoyl-CoA dioxygenase family protein n=1 Tax=Negadavirga shengliensis TaxID=1389218 RepID=A0ABV9T6A5_9BACT
MNTYKLSQRQLDFFEDNGYLVVEHIISPQEVTQYKAIYDDFLSGKIDVGGNRSDLGEDLGESKTVENITQIMWPSKFLPELLEMVYHQRVLAVSKALMGDDMEMDFDMLINKAPGTNTITPWHQDEAYWMNMPDKRSVSCWLSLDHATEENGCMWFVPGSNNGKVRSHRFASKEGGALVCDASEEEGVAVPLLPGSCTFHHGRTLHYSRGNSSSHQRRAFIINLRPKAMIQLERKLGYDHGKESGSKRKLDNEEFK